MKFPTPVNPQNNLSNNHCFYVGSSGCGKTSAVKNLPNERRINKGDQIVFFDPFGDYAPLYKGEKVQYFSTKSAFYLALIKARKSKKAFRIAYQPNNINFDEINFFCGAVWSVGDGKRKLVVIIEEVAQFISTSGNAKGYLNNLISVGRKFNFSCNFIFQRGQAIPKTLIANCGFCWIGAQSREKDAVYLGDEIGINKTEIINLKKLEYIFKKQGEKSKKGRLTFN